MDSTSVSFGISVLRGLVKDLTKDECFRFTQAFILDKENKCLVVGHDLRPSSPAIAKLCPRRRLARLFACLSLPCRSPEITQDQSTST